MSFQTSLCVRALILSVAITLFLTDRTNGNPQRINTVSVERGRFTDLAPTLKDLLASDVNDSSCNVTVLDPDWTRCGTIQPNVFLCSDLFLRLATVAYSHFGCFASTEVLRFQIARGRSISRLRIDANVSDSSHRLAAIRERLKLRTTRIAEQLFELQLLFSSEWRDACFYSIAVFPGVLPLPQFGDFTGPTNNLYSCGFVPKEPLLYVQRSPGRKKQDYVVLSFSESHFADQQRFLFPLDLPKEGNYSHTVQTFPEFRLSVRHTGLSPLHADSFLSAVPPLGDHLKFHIKGNGGVFVIDGVFYDHVSDLSVFTSDDLMNGIVSFLPFSSKPSDSTTSSTVFDVSVFDSTGLLLAMSTLKVEFEELLPVLPLTLVIHGGTFEDLLTPLQSSVSLVDLNSSCDHILSHKPERGFFGRDHLHQDSSVIFFNQSEFMSDHLSYHLKPFTSSVCSWIRWFIGCGRSSLEISVYLVHDVLAPSPPRLDFSIDSLGIASGYATQLNGLMLQASASYTNNWDIEYIVQGHHTIIVRNESQRIQPFLPIGELMSTPHIAQLVDKFTQEHLDKGMVWYIPSEIHTSSVANITLHLRGTSISNPIVIDIKPLSTPKSNQIESVYEPLKVNPLVLSPLAQSSTITPKNIKSFESDMMYSVQFSPLWGRICSTDQHCDTSRTSFTQKEIDVGTIHYVAFTTDFELDAFAFAAANDLPQSLHWLVVRRSLSRADLSRKKAEPSKVVEIAVRQGENVTLSSSMFPPLFPTLSMYIVRPPLHGTLSVNNSFTATNLENRSIWYMHSGRPFCTDTLLLAILFGSKPLDYISIRFVYQVEESMSLIPPVTVGDKLFHHPSIALGVSDISFFDSNCGISAVIRIQDLPRYGNITYGSTDGSNQTHPLQPGSEISLEDIVLGRIGYEVQSQFITSKGISDSFSFVAPFLFNSSKYTLLLNYSDNHTQYNISVSVLDYMAYVSEIGNGLYGIRLKSSLLTVDAQPQPAPKATLICFQHLQRFHLHYHNREENVSRVENSSCFPVEDMLQFQYSLQLDVLHVMDTNVSEELIGIEARVYHTSGQILSASTPVNISAQWSFVYFQETEISLAEKTTLIFEVSLRRIGALNVSATFQVVVVGGNATNNCSGRGLADVCVGEAPVVMALGIEEATFRIEFFPDELMEGTESLTLEIVHTIHSVPLPGKSRMDIHITDSLSNPTRLRLSPSKSRPSNRPLCDREITISENIGTVSIPIAQVGTPQGRVGVICYTEDGSVGSEVDFVPRLNVPSSLLLLEGNHNQSVVTCQVSIVNDKHHEFEEYFVVVLGQTIGNTQVDPAYDRLCVQISNDLTEEASVGFAVSHTTLTLAEVDVPQLLRVNLVRTGSPSSLVTPTRVHLAFSQASNHTGFEGMNYFIFPTVLFEPNATTAEFVVVVHEVHSATTLLIEIVSVENGTKAEDGQEVSILVIPPQMAIIEFDTLDYVIKETRDIQYITVVRRGNPNAMVTVRCVQHSREAVAGLDFHSKSEIIKLGPNTTFAFCSLQPIDDNLWEWEEGLEMGLEIVDGHAVIGENDRATIKLVDPEDIPTVQFSNRNIVETEPLSQFRPDARNVTVWLVRSGDPSIPFRVQYFTENGKGDNVGVAGADYESVRGIAEFDSNVMSVRIDIKLLSNHQKDRDFQFLVRVQRLPNATGPLLGSNTSVAVHVNNHRLKGAFFPEQPRIVSRDNYSVRDTLSAYKPLLCLTPCDSEWEGDPKLKESCNNQHIDPELTKYTWEMSVTNWTDPSQGSTIFLPIEFANILISPQQRYLDPAYMFRDRIVRCRVTAVDESNVAGYTRVSEPVRLVHVPQEACSASDDISKLVVTGKLTSHTSGVLSLDSVVKLSLSHILHFDNQIPLISTAPFPEDVTSLLTYIPARNNHKCSNLQIEGFHSLSGTKGGRNDRPLSVYTQLNYITCQWRFESYHKIRDLTDVCGATLNHEGGETTINVPIYLTYAHVVPWGVIPSRAYSVSTTVNLAVPSHLFTSTTPPTAVENIVNTSQNASLYVLSVTVENRQLKVILETILNSSRDEYFSHDDPLIQAEYEGVFSVRLVQTTPPGNEARQMWEVTSLTELADYSGKYTLELSRCELLYRITCSFVNRVTFQFQIERNENGDGYMPGLIVTTVQHGSDNKQYTIGSVISISLLTNRSQQLSQGVGVRVIGGDLCQSQNRGRRMCSLQGSIKVSSLPGRTRRSTDNVSLPLHTLQLHTATLTEGKWYIDVRYVIVKDNQIIFDGPNSEGFVESDHFNLTPETPSTSFVTSSNAATEDPTLMIVAIFLSTVAVIAFVFLCIVAMVAVSRRLRRKRLQQGVSPQVARRQSNVRLHYHGVATRTTRERGTERFECHLELLQCLPEVSSLPDAQGQSNRHQKKLEFADNVLSSTPSHKSLPAPLSWAGEEKDLSGIGSDSTLQFSMGSETGTHKVDYMELHLAVTAQSPRGHKLKEETSL